MAASKTQTMRRLCAALLALLSWAEGAEAQAGGAMGRVGVANTAAELIQVLQSNHDHVVIQQHMDLTTVADHDRFGVVTLHHKSIRV